MQQVLTITWEINLAYGDYRTYTKISRMRSTHLQMNCQPNESEPDCCRPIGIFLHFALTQLMQINDHKRRACQKMFRQQISQIKESPKCCKESVDVCDGSSHCITLPDRQPPMHTKRSGDVVTNRCAHALCKGTSWHLQTAGTATPS